MNAPLRRSETMVEGGTLKLFALFHLNLAFSSIEEEQRIDVIRRCYWPLLDLADAYGPIGIEATGFTLEEIAARDPTWIARAKELLGRGRIELIGSGFAQIIAPLVPWRVTEANLRIGNAVYRDLLGTAPQLALVNEQAYASGLVGLYLDAGYRAILMDWDNPGSQHPHWPLETRYRPQRALGADGRSIGLLWTNTVAFQKLQRYAHGDLALHDYIGYLRGQRATADRVLCAYASDAEIFDFRPGRYKTEEKISGTEWTRIGEAFAALAAEPALERIAPSAALAGAGKPQPLKLETATCPVPVKKQRKYNLSRWAVTGRDDLGINAACQRIHDGLAAAGTGEEPWKELCYLWSSDFRTHITDARWIAFVKRLAEAERRWVFPRHLRRRPCLPRLRCRVTSTSRRRPFALGSIAAAASRSTRSISCPMRAPRSAACRTAISTTSRCRRTGTRAIVSSRHRANTRSLISNGAKHVLRRMNPGTCAFLRASRLRKAPSRSI